MQLPSMQDAWSYLRHLLPVVQIRVDNLEQLQEDRRKPKYYRRMTTTVGQLDCPKLFVPISLSKLESRNTRLYNLLNRHHTQFYEEPSDNSHFLATEGDVERAASLYLFRPVNRILDTLNLDYKMVSQKTTQSSRTDHQWHLMENGNLGRVFLVFETKAPYVLRKTDWENAFVSSNHTAEELVHLSYQAGSSIRLKDNAAKLCHQMTQYANICPLVVAFDWLQMAIIDFAPGGYQWSDERNPAELGWLNDARHGGMTFREALLSAALHGLRKCGVSITLR